MKIRILILSAIIIIRITGCSDDDAGWEEGPTLTGSPVASTELYEIRDFTLPSGSATLRISNLNTRDRIVLIPLYTDYKKEDTTLNTVFRLKSEYSGGRVPDTRSLYAPHVPPVEPFSLKQRSIARDGGPLARRMGRTISRAYTAKDTVHFRLRADYNNTARYISARARLLYTGTHCYVFFTENLATNSKARSIATTIGREFDNVIRPRITALYGYERGGEPAGDGGVDMDRKVCILYENVTANPPAGYFSSLNQSAIHRNSNKKEMFVICSRHAYLKKGYDKSDIVAHEYQHLIAYNRAHNASGASLPTFFNEGLAQVAEGVAGFGPNTKMAYVQVDPRLSYAGWGMDGKSIAYSYGAAFAVTSYLVRRFGASFISNLLETSFTSIENVSTLLSNYGYSSGYPGIILDMLSAHYLNDGVYSYPAAGLYPGDTGISTQGTTDTWKEYPSATTNIHHLCGPATKFFKSFPAEITGSLYQYGADMYEFVSGHSGSFTFLFNEISSGLRVRMIHYRPGSETQPHIDGYLDDWAGRATRSLSDPAYDNNRLYDSAHASSFASGGVDITNVSGYISNDIMYLAIRVREPAAINNPGNHFLLKLDVKNTLRHDYYLDLKSTQLLLQEIGRWGSSRPVVLSTTGLNYSRRDALEIKIPLLNFPGNIKTTISIEAYGYSDGPPRIFDLPAGRLQLRR